MANKEQQRQFFAKQKVPICLAITDSFMFFEDLVDARILTKAESLFQVGTNSVPRAIYKHLCLIEEKEMFDSCFTILSQKHYLDRFPDLKRILKKYECKRYKISTTSSSTRTNVMRKKFQRSKVAIAFAIQERFPFLQGLQDWGMLSERQSLRLQTDERPDDRVLYESLCLVEEKGKQFEQFFHYVLQKCFLKLFPKLKKISKQHKKQQTDSEKDKKLRNIFQHNKVEICMAITKKFPFLNGLCDLGFLSQGELISLQADDKQIERVIYKSLRWTAEKKINFKEFVDYISQNYLWKTYPKLEKISKVSTQIEPGNTERYGIRTEELSLILKRERTRISNAISKTFPFMVGLQDRNILSKMESLKLQADGMIAMNTVHTTICLIEEEKKDLIREFFDYLSQDMYLEMFPELKNILQCILKNSREEIVLGSSLSPSYKISKKSTDQLQDSREEIVLGSSLSPSYKISKKSTDQLQDSRDKIVLGSSLSPSYKIRKISMGQLQGIKEDTITLSSPDIEDESTDGSLSASSENTDQSMPEICEA